MAHGGVVIGAVAGAEIHRLIELGVEPHRARQHEEKLLAIVAHPAAELVDAARMNDRPVGDHPLGRDLCGEQRVLIGRRRMLAALRGPGDRAPAGHPIVGGRREELGDVDPEAARELLHRIKGRRHLGVFDLGERRAREPGPLRRLLEGPVAGLAELADAGAQIERTRRLARALSAAAPRNGQERFCVSARSLLGHPPPAVPGRAGPVAARCQGARRRERVRQPCHSLRVTSSQ